MGSNRSRLVLQFLFPDLFLEDFYGFFQRVISQISSNAVTHGQRFLGRFTLAEDDHVGDELDLGAADLRADFFRPAVRLDSQTLSTELSRNFLCVLLEFGAHGQDPDLLRGQPERKRAGEMLDQNPDETLKRVQRRAVQNHRLVRVIVRADVTQAETLLRREFEVDVNDP